MKAYLLIIIFTLSLSACGGGPMIIPMILRETGPDVGIEQLL